MKGPDRVTAETLEALRRELAALKDAPWTSLSVETDMNSYGVYVSVLIPDDDPFEPSRLDKIFDLAESLIVSRIPNEIGIHENNHTWTVSVHTEGDRALIDYIWGGNKMPGRTERASDGLGPPDRQGRG
jgi:hypothetical protein